MAGIPKASRNDEESTDMRTIAVTALALATGVTVGAVQAEVDQSATEAVKEAVKTLWQDQHKAWDAHDIDGVIDGVLATYADSDDIMLMGTGPGEHWVGQKEIRDAYAHFMENFDAHTMEVQCGEGAGSTRGDVVWLTGVCNFTDEQGDQPRQFVTNLSAVLVKQGDGWVTSDPDYRFGNLLECDSLSELLRSSPARQRFVDRPVRLMQGDCIQCDYLALCHGGCPVRTYTMHGSLFEKDPYCHLYKSLYRHAEVRPTQLAGTAATDGRVTG
jgi:radical SAM protein with 4Fe4S-binding SPASM domain